MNNKSVLGTILVVVGCLIVMKIFNIHLGWIFGLLMPLIFIGLGVVGFKNNRKTIGSILIVIGAIMLLTKLSGIIMLLLAIGLIVWGVSMFKHRRHL